MAKDVESEQSFAIGMYVRFPFEAERTDNDFRDFRIGQIRDINPVAVVRMLETIQWCLKGI